GVDPGGAAGKEEVHEVAAALLELAELVLRDALLAEPERRAAHERVGAFPGARPCARAEQPARAERFAVLDDRLVERRIVRDASGGPDLDLERPALDGGGRHADQLLSLRGQRERRVARYAGRVRGGRAGARRRGFVDALERHAADRAEPGLRPDDLRVHRALIERVRRGCGVVMLRGASADEDAPDADERDHRCGREEPSRPRHGMPRISWRGRPARTAGSGPPIARSRSATARAKATSISTCSTWTISIVRAVSTSARKSTPPLS